MDRLRRLWRALLRYLSGEDEPIAIRPEAAERELGALRNVAALSVAQAQRAELELREALADPSTVAGELDSLMLQLTELRDRARRDVVAYREHQRSVAEALDRLGEATRVAQIGRQREDMRRFLARSEAAMDLEALQAIEDEARAEAARLDFLQQLETGHNPVSHRPEPRHAGDLRQRAQTLVDQSAFSDLLGDD
jgi:hypothetical protein